MNNQPELVAKISQNYRHVLEQINLAASRVGRDPKSVKLVVVTKTHPIEVVKAAVQAGINRFGENYAEEAVSKMEGTGFKADLEWHMIGHVQSRKAKLVCRYFHMVHSLDSLKLAVRLSNFCEIENRILPVLLECNTSGEKSKFGFNISQSDLWDHVLSEFSKILNLHNLRILGLMTMAPYSECSEDARPFFKKLVEFQKRLQENLPQSSWDELSMGMSGDYEVAVEEGATYVRIGQAILGQRI